MTMKLKTLSEILNCRLEGPGEVEISGVEYDSRRISRAAPDNTGLLFAAVPGEKTDGHLYVADAISRGAKAILVEKPVEGVDLPQLIVDDVRDALAHSSELVYGEPSRGMKLIGVTGTNGKTTITYLLESIFNAAGFSTGVVGTVNYRYGGNVYPASHTTPEAPDLARLLKEMVGNGVARCIMEVSSHALAQKRVEAIGFDAAVFTNLTHEHLDYHRTMEEYFEAKARLFKRLLKYPEAGRAIVNIDDTWGSRLAGEIGRPDVLTYSLSDGADVYPMSFELAENGIEALVVIRKDIIKVASPLVGEYNLSNILAAVAAARTLGVDARSITEGIANLRRVPGRLEPLDADGPVRFRAYVDYAHTGDALKRALASIKAVSRGRIITVFGCGGNRDKLKRPQMGSIAARMSDVTIVTSDNPRDEDPLEIIKDIEAGVMEIGGVEKYDDPASLVNGHKGYSLIPDRREAIMKAVECARNGDTILVAGKGHEDYQIVKGQRLRFDDIEILHEAMDSLSARVKGAI